MIIEETITIKAPLSRVWNLFHDLTCWADWNTILNDVKSAETCLIEGGKFSCCIRPYAFPVYFQPKVIEIVPEKKIVWTGRKYWISSLHEFFFEEKIEGTIIRSREVFSGLPIILGGFLFPRQRLTGLTTSFLEDLKRASEAAV
jgi:uncharacterized protein YndB with AHSA1/START domain